MSCACFGRSHFPICIRITNINKTNRTFFNICLLLSSNNFPVQNSLILDNSPVNQGTEKGIFSAVREICTNNSESYLYTVTVIILYCSVIIKTVKHTDSTYRWKQVYRRPRVGLNGCFPLQTLKFLILLTPGWQKNIVNPCIMK